MKSLSGLYRSSFDEVQRISQDLQSDSITEKEKKGYFESLYKDSLIQQAVNVPVQDSLSNWRKPIDKELERLDKALSIKSTFIKAGIEARIHRRSMIIPAIVDRQTRARIPLTTTLSKLEENKDRYEVVRLVVISHFDDSGSIETNVNSENHGQPKHYIVGESKVHASRCAIINANNAGISFIESIFEYYCAFKERDIETTRAVKEANFLAFGTDLNMLIEQAIKQSDATGSDPEHIVASLLRDRLSELRRNANNSGAWGYDKQSEKVEQVSKTNIKDMVTATDQSAKHFSAAVDIPASRFWDFRPSGMAGDGGDGKNYNQTLVGLRSFMFEEALSKVDHIIQAFNPKIKTVDYDWNELPIIQ